MKNKEGMNEMEYEAGEYDVIVIGARTCRV